MTLFQWVQRFRRHVELDQAKIQLEQVAVETAELEKRVERLEADARVFTIQRRRELRSKGISC